MYQLLVVDDEPLIRSYLKSNLHKIHPDWVVSGEASDGSEALEFLSSQKVDLILTDVKMPVMNGLELCREVYRRYPGQRIVVLSGYDEFTFAKEAIKYSVNDYLLKPINNRELHQLLDRMASQIEETNKREWTLNSLKGLSQEYQHQITCNYLRAIIANIQTEIKVLHPLLYKMKIDLIEGVCTVMVLKLDIASALNLSIPIDDLKIYQYILHQAAKETVECKFKGFVFNDVKDNVIVYVTKDQAHELQQTCREIFYSVSDFLKQHTGLSIIGLAGQCRTDVLELNSAYTEALNLIPEYLLTSSEKLFLNPTTNKDLKRKILQLERCIASIVAAIPQYQEPSFITLVAKLIEQINPLDNGTVIKYAHYLFEQILKLHPEKANKSEAALKHLSCLLLHGHHLTVKELIQYFVESIGILVEEDLEPDEAEEVKLAEKARDYILAHYAEPISLAQVADVFSVSAGYLSKIFHETFGETYIKYLTRVRMEQAAKLLRAVPPEPILRIAEKTGYINTKHFCYVFKQYHNMTASEFLKYANEDPGR